MESQVPFSGILSRDPSQNPGKFFVLSHSLMYTPYDIPQHNVPNFTGAMYTF